MDNNASKASIEKIISQRIKVLVADDDVPTRMLLKTAISQWGYQVIEAGNGEEAWKLLNSTENIQEPPQILLLDWIMPVLDGLALCQRIRNTQTHFCYIILLTQLTGSQYIQQAIEAGADEFLSKPFNMVELRNRLLIGAKMISYENLISRQEKLLTKLTSNITTLSTSLTEVAPQLQSIDQFKKDNFIKLVQELNTLSGEMVSIKTSLAKDN